MRLVFFGTPDTAVRYLERLLTCGHEVCAVVTQPDRAAGRGKKLQPPAVKRFSEQARLRVLQPRSCREESFCATLREMRPMCGVVVAYGNLLPAEVLACPERGCVNVHYSILPQLRGAAPVQHALLQGLTETGVTVQAMSTRLDAGDIILAETVPIDPEDDAFTLTEKLNQVGPPLLLRALEMIEQGTARFVPQDESQATWAPPLTAGDCRIDWREPAEQVRNRIRACAPRPGAFTMRRNRRLKVLRAAMVPEELGKEGQPGSVAETTCQGHPLVWTGRGALALLEVQPEGKQRMAGAAYARGARLIPGERFE